MDPQVHAEMKDICGQFHSQTGIGVSSTACDLAAAIVSAIVEDPHPKWKWHGNRPKLKGARADYLASTPKRLHQIVASENVKDEITSFDLLHWLSGNISTMICIIPK